MFGRSPRHPFRSLSSPERISLFTQVVGLLLIIGVGWALFLVVIAFFKAWMVVLLAAGLGVPVYLQGGRQRRRQAWIDAGRCASCGYDVTRLPTAVCSECGRDAALDEPVWRRLRREHEAKFGRPELPATGVELDDATVCRLLAKAEQSLGDL